MAGPPEFIGAYRLFEALGRGGMGVVYRAQHRETGQSVALKTVDIPNEWALSGLRREIHALARIRHPQVVRVLDEGVHEGLPWYAMELLQGRTLRSLASDWFGRSLVSPPSSSLPGTDGMASDSGMTDPAWWTATLNTLSAGSNPTPTASADAYAPGGAKAGSESIASTPAPVAFAPAAAGRLEEVLTLVRRLCLPLAYLHGEGIVHRDLKLENVIVGADAVPILVDFGLISESRGELSRDAVEVRMSGTGSLLTMAPEQILGELVDARADLYALGCILYELLTGQAPHRGTTPAAILYGHLRESPRPPSTLVSGVARELDDLVLRLLAKEPRERMGHADDVAAALGALGGGNGLSRQTPRPRPYLYRPGFAGRIEALRTLERLLARLQDNQGSVVFVGGESGVGKTRLAIELMRKAESVHALVLAGECQPLAMVAPGAEPGRGGPFHPFRPVLERIGDRCRERGLLETERLLGARGKILAPYAPGLIGLPGQEAYAEPVELPADAMVQRLYLALAETLAALTLGVEPHGRNRVLLVLDDLQWADDLTLGFLEFALRTGTLTESRGLPLLLLGTYRTEELGATHAAPLREVLHAQAATRLVLGRLEPDAVGSIVRDMLALGHPPESFVEYLTRRSEGNPFFVAEYLRAALMDGLLERDRRGCWLIAEQSLEVRAIASEQQQPTFDELIPLPRSLHELIARRLQGLPAEARRVTEAAAVIGRKVDPLQLRHMTSLEEHSMLAAISDLLGRQILEEVGNGELRFVHDQIREVAYTNIEASLRSHLHGEAARHLESSPNGKTAHAALGYHWECAGAPERARPAYLEAARKARDSYSDQEAERLYLSYLRLADELDSERIQARIELGHDVRHLRRNRRHEALADLKTALEEARAVADRSAQAACLQRLGAVLLGTAQSEQIRRYFEESLELSRTIGDRQVEAMSLSGLGKLHKHLGQVVISRGFNQEALAIERELGNRTNEGIVLGNLATLDHAQGHHESARSLYEQALLVHQDVGDLLSESRVLCNLAILESSLGEYVQSREHYVRALAIAREIGNRRSEAVTLSNLTSLEQELGEIPSAIEHGEQALAIFREVGDRHFEGSTLVGLAHHHGIRGELEIAQELFEQAIALLRETGDRNFEGIACLYSAVLARRTAQLATAEANLNRARAIFDELASKIWITVCLCELGHLNLAQGKPAARVLAEARAIGSLLDVDAKAPLGRALFNLERAVQAGESGVSLLRGECLESFPPLLLRRLAESGHLAEIERSMEGRPAGEASEAGKC